jgi:hypothetical protein
MPLIPPNRVTAFPLKDDLYWYDPDVIFQPFDDIFGRGVVGSTDLQVVANAPDGQISVQPGRGYVPYQSGGKRLFRTNVAIRSDSSAEFQRSVGAYTGTPRVDRVVAKVLDATLNPPDSLKGGVFDVLPGVPTAGATLANLSGAVSVPSTTLLLGNVLVSAATIPSGNIDSTFGSTRARARIGGGNSPSKTIQVAGAAMTDRTALNLIPGTGISITGADNAGADSSDVTIAAVGGFITRSFQTTDTVVAGINEAGATTIISTASVTFQSQPVIIIFYSALVQRNNPSNNPQNCFITLLRDTTTIHSMWAQLYTPSISSAGVHLGFPVLLRAFDTPSAGTHTYTVKAWAGLTNEWVFNASAGGSGNLAPTSLEVSYQ